MQIIETTEMETEVEMERVIEMILLIPIETIEVPIEVPPSPINEEGDNKEQSFTTECHGTKWRHPIEVLDAKIN